MIILDANTQVDADVLLERMHKVSHEQHTPAYHHTLSLLVQTLVEQHSKLTWGADTSKHEPANESIDKESTPKKDIDSGGHSLSQKS